MFFLSLYLAYLPMIYAYIRDPGEVLYCGRNTDCYGLLNLKREDVLKLDTEEEKVKLIKKQFRRLSLKYHPDKRIRSQKQKSPDKSLDDDEEEDEVQRNFPSFHDDDNISDNLSEEDLKNKRMDDLYLKMQKANEILISFDLREAYNYYLDNPDSDLVHTYQFYKATYVGMRIPSYVIYLGLLVFITLGQIINRIYQKNAVIQAVSCQPVFIKRLEEVMKTGIEGYDGFFFSTLDEAAIYLLENEVSLPDLTEVTDVKSWAIVYGTIVFPIHLSAFIYFHLSWLYRRRILKLEYSHCEKEYLTMRALGISEMQWSRLPDGEFEDINSTMQNGENHGNSQQDSITDKDANSMQIRQKKQQYSDIISKSKKCNNNRSDRRSASEKTKSYLISKELWIPQNFQKFREECEEDFRDSGIMESAKYKRYKRMMKKKN